eukprot:364446-Chlamydomonas_euryale.AAC.9
MGSWAHVLTRCGFLFLECWATATPRRPPRQAHLNPPQNERGPAEGAPALTPSSAPASRPPTRAYAAPCQRHAAVWSRRDAGHRHKRVRWRSQRPVAQCCSMSTLPAGLARSMLPTALLCMRGSAHLLQLSFRQPSVLLRLYALVAHLEDCGEKGRGTGRRKKAYRPQSESY